MSNIHAGDELDDGLDYQVDISDSESQSAVATTPSVEEPVPQGKKRKQTNNKLHEKKRIKMEMDIEKKKLLSKEESPEAIVDYLNEQIRRNNPDLSALELTDKYFSKTDVRSTADFTEPRTLENITVLINNRFKNMLPAKKNKKKDKKKDQKGDQSVDDKDSEERKFIAIMSMSAIRACDVHRATKDISGSSLKIINKNKINVDLKLLTSTNSRVLCCTPGRLHKVLLAENSPLSAEELKIVIMDSTFLDQKMQNVWDLKETADVLKELTTAGTKIYLY